MGRSERSRTVFTGPVLGGRYELREPIGEGANGTVFRGIQRPLGREVAIKVLRSDAGATAAMRFAREISLVQRLEHPNTVRLYDFGTHDDGSPFIVFELLRGRTLEAEIARGPLAPARVAKIAVQILKALMEAHGHGIVHRDVKPANVLLVDYSGERDFVKVLDFGVARSLEAVDDPKITRHGQIVGTPAYMAPEQVREARLSPRTDLYAVGLLMAEALAGRPVFTGSDGAVWVAQASDAPVPLSPLVSGSILGSIVERATRKDPGGRYGSAREMIDDIERVTSDEAIQPTAPTVPDPAPTDPTFSLDRIPTPPSFAPAPMSSALRTAKHYAMGAFLAMVVLMVALIVVQLRVARQAAASPRTLVAHVERIESVGWRVERLADNDVPGVRTQVWVVRAPEDLNKGWIYLSTFDDEQRARSFATYARAGNPTLAVKQMGRQVLRTQAADATTAARLLTLVE